MAKPNERELIRSATKKLLEQQREAIASYSDLILALQDLDRLLEVGDREAIAEHLQICCDNEYEVNGDCEVFGGLVEELGFDDEVGELQEQQLNERDTE